MATGGTEDHEEPVEVTVIKVENRGFRGRTIAFVLAGLGAVFAFAMITSSMSGNDTPVVVDAATTVRSGTTFATATDAPTTTEDPSTTVADTTLAPTTVAPTTTVFWVPLPADFIKPTTTTAKPRSTSKKATPAFIPVPDFIPSATTGTPATTQPPDTTPTITAPTITAPMITAPTIGN